jgi:hypothetical protein
MDVEAGAQEAKTSEISKTVTMLLIFIDYLIVQGTAQRLVLAAAAAQARLLRLKTTRLARGAYPQAAKPLSAANGVRRLFIY